MVIGILGERSLATFWTPPSSELIAISDLSRSTNRTLGDRINGIHRKLLGTPQANVGRIITDTSRKVLMIRVISVSLFPVQVDIIRIAVRPCVDTKRTPSAHKSLTLSHFDFSFKLRLCGNPAVYTEINLQYKFNSRMLSIELTRVLAMRGSATTMARHWARDMATLTRLRSRMKPRPREPYSP